MLATEWPDPRRFEVGAATEPARPSRSGPMTTRHEMGSNRPVEAGDWVATAGDASIETRLAVEVCRITGDSGADLTIPGPTSRSQREVVVVNSVDDIFEENPDGYQPDQEDLASDIMSRPLATMAGPRFAPTEPLDDPVALGTEWDQWDDVLTTSPESPSVVCECFEPIAVADDREEGIADERSRGFAAIRVDAPQAGYNPSPRLLSSFQVENHPPSPVLDRSRNPTRHDELGRALALTRDAARAWMDVLAGQTLVRVSSR